MAEGHPAGLITMQKKPGSSRRCCAHPRRPVDTPPDTLSGLQAQGPCAAASPSNGSRKPASRAWALMLQNEQVKQECKFAPWLVTRHAVHAARMGVLGPCSHCCQVFLMHLAMGSPAPRGRRPRSPCSAHIPVPSYSCEHCSHCAQPQAHTLTHTR